MYIYFYIFINIYIYKYIFAYTCTCFTLQISWLAANRKIWSYIWDGNQSPWLVNQKDIPLRTYSGHTACKEIWLLLANKPLQPYLIVSKKCTERLPKSTSRFLSHDFLNATFSLPCTKNRKSHFLNIKNLRSLNILQKTQRKISRISRHK